MFVDNALMYIATRNVLQLREMLREALPDLQPTAFGRRISLAQAARRLQHCPETGLACSCVTMCNPHGDLDR